MAAITATYTTKGGLSAVVYTDAIQTCVLLMAGAVLTILGLQHVGGWAAEPLPQFEFNRASTNRAGLKESDVCLSCRMVNKAHPALEAFHTWRPTRLEWSYIMDEELIKAVTRAGVEFVGTINTNQFPGPESNAETFEGKTAIAPWMQYFNEGRGVPYTCANKPATLSRRIELLKRYADLGVGVVLHDDWAYNLSTYFWGGGCFCGDCRAGFASYLSKYAGQDRLAAAGVSTWEGFDYREYLKNRYGWQTDAELIAGRKDDPLNEDFRIFCVLSTRAYFDRLLAAVQSPAGGPFILAANSNTGLSGTYHGFLLDRVDYNVGETTVCTDDTPWKIAYILKMADALRIPQVLSPRPDGTEHDIDVRRVRQAIAVSYALGHRMLIPWDVWLMGKTERWWGAVEDYGDLFEFVRESAALLDGYRARTRVVMAVPLSQDWGQTTALERTTIRLLRSMMRAGVSARFASFGRTALVIHIPVEQSDFKDASAVVTFENTTVDPEDAGRLDRCIRESEARHVRVNLYSTFPERAALSAIADVCPSEFRIDTSDLMLIPRERPQDPSSPLVLHLVNTGPSETAPDIWLSDTLLDGRSAAGAVLLRPGKQPLELNPAPSSTGVRLSGVAVDVWSILVIKRS